LVPFVGEIIEQFTEVGVEFVRAVRSGTELKKQQKTVQAVRVLLFFGDEAIEDGL
jgi:hypothetical protein